MASVDSNDYLANGGYLQKGRKVNLCEADLGKEVQDLLPSRYSNTQMELTVMFLTFFLDGTEMRKSFSLKEELYFPVYDEGQMWG
jgi:hypothetical protein